MCSPTIGGGPWIRPGVSEKSMSEPNWRMRPSSEWSYSATRPSRSLSPSNSTYSPALVSNATSFGTPAASSARVHWIAVRVAKRGSSSDSSCLRFSARGARVANRSSEASSGAPTVEHNASQCASVSAAIWIQPSCVSYSR